GQTFVAMRVFWPSKRFADSDLIPGGGAASAVVENDAATKHVLDALRSDSVVLGEDKPDPVRDAHIERAIELLPKLESDPDARREYVFILRSLLDPSAAHADDASIEFFTADPQKLFDELEGEVVAPPPASAGGATSLGGGGASTDAGGAAGLGDLLKGAKAAARRLANFATYYRMKARAGTVGSVGVASVLRRVREVRPEMPIHLIGHSFGGRLVTAAAHALDPDTPKVTISLLQAAFSHNGLSGGFGDDGQVGFFREVLSKRRASGPIIITHTKNDKAVGVAYPLASRIARQVAAALGDRNDPYGGMGRNGAQNTDEARGNEATLGLPGTEYSFEPGKVHNLEADLIRDHGDVGRIEVAYAVLCNAGAVG
ncbi:MAG TPA: hypothetical protein VF190_06765, partial [Rhodothermales bacterium]